MERVWERRVEREVGEKETSRWRECLMGRVWDWVGKGEIAWKWWRGCEAEERNEERRERESGGKEPTRRMWRETGREKERREETMEGRWGGGRWE